MYACVCAGVFMFRDTVQPLRVKELEYSLTGAGTECTKNSRFLPCVWPMTTNYS